MPKDKSPSKAVKVPLLCKKTGGKVDDIVYRLLKHGDDDDLDVQNEIFQSLTMIGKAQPLFVVTQGVDFITTDSPKTAHRARIIQLVASIIENETKGDSKRDVLLKSEKDSDTAEHIIQFATNQIIVMKNQPKVQNNAVKLLVALSYQHCDVVVDSILKHFKTGSIPDYYVLKSLADTAKCNPIPFVEKLTEIFTKVTPILAMVKKTDHIQIFTLALGRFAEAILKYQEEREEQLLRAKEREDEKVDDNNPFQDDIDTETTEKQLTIQFTEFASNCASAFDIVFTNWRKVSDKKIKMAVAESIGLLTEVMSKKKFLAKFAEIISYFGTNLKSAHSKVDDQPPLTRGMCSVLKVMYRDELADGAVDDIEKHLQMAMDVLHPLAAKNPNYDDQKGVKNHTNILMSFEYMARSRLTQTLTYLLSKFQTKSSGKSQLSSLLILKHLVNAMDDRLSTVKEQILSSCLQLMEVTNMEVRKAFIQLIMAMADQDYLALEGGQNMVLFLVKMGSIKQSPDDHAAKQIKSGADHILHVIASKVQSSHSVLWPYLFELLISHRNQFAVGTISRVLSLIARHKKSSGDTGTLYIKWHKDVNLPHPGELLAKLFVLLHRPYLTKNYGEYICALLYNIGGILHEELASLFTDNFKIVGKYIKDNGGGGIASGRVVVMVDKKLQSMLLKLFRSTCETLESDDAFITEIGDAFIKQFAHYQKDEYLQNVSLTLLGQTLAFSNKKAYISKQLSKMIEVTNVKSLQHQKGCALGLALCSVTHLDTVLLRTTALIEESKEVKKGGLFGFGKKKELPGSTEKKCLCVRSWGQIASKCPPKSVTSRLDAHVFVHLLKVMELADSDAIRNAVIEAVTMISMAMNEARSETSYRVKKRDTFIEGMLKYIKTTKQESMKKEALRCISSLLYLAPAVAIDDDLRKNVIEVVLRHLNHCSASEVDDTPSTPRVTDSDTPSSTIGLLECMQTVLIALLETQPSMESLCQLIFKLEFWIVSKRTNERICALETYRLLTKRFIGILRKQQDTKGKEKALKNLGHYLATIIPRVTDNDTKVRELALDTIQMLLFVDQLLRNPGNEKPSDELRSLNALKKELNKEKIAEHRLQKMYYLTEILCRLTSAEEMQSLLVNLIRGVNDNDRQSALGTCKALQGILKERAIETKQYVAKLLDINLVELKKIINDDRKKSVLIQQLKSICILTREHFDDILAILHKQSMPMPPETVLVFKALAADLKLQSKVIEYELNVINSSPIDEAGPTPNVCIATKALQTMFTLSEMKQVVKSDEYYYQFMATLITRLGTASCKKAKKGGGGGSTKGANGKDKDTSSGKKDGGKSPGNGDKKKLTKTKSIKKLSPRKSPKSPKGGKADDDTKDQSDDEGMHETKVSKSVGYAVGDTIMAIQYFLNAADERSLVNEMNECATWKKFENAKNYELGVAELVDKWATTRATGSATENVAKRQLLFDAVMPYFKKHFVGHRNSAAVVVAEMIRHTGSNKVFLDKLVQELLPRISDGQPRVRRQGLVGLGNLSDVWSDELIANGTAPAILASLTSAVEDKVEIVCISAIRSLIKILAVIDVNTVTPSLINICFRTRPFLDSENEQVRVEAFKLFGKLCKFGASNYNFLEQVHKNMTAFICHINDVNDAVSKEVYNTLLVVFKYLEDDQIIEEVLTPHDDFDDSVDEVIGKSNYNSLMVKLVPILCNVEDRKYYDHLTLYLQAAVAYMQTSRWGEIRGNAALFSAKIIQSVDPQFASTHLDVASVINMIMQLLKSKSARVRRRSAKSLSYLSGS